MTTLPEMQHDSDIGVSNLTGAGHGEIDQPERAEHETAKKTGIGFGAWLAMSWMGLIIFLSVFADFLPLKPFRSLNWQARWQRLRKAADNLAVLPPIDVLRYRDRYCVLDGHNRVALGLYGGQLAIDANVTANVAPGETAPEAPAAFGSPVAARQARG